MPCDAHEQAIFRLMALAGSWILACTADRLKIAVFIGLQPTNKNSGESLQSNRCSGCAEQLIFRSA